MRRWEKEVLKTIRTEAANSLRTPGTSIGGREPELTRALFQISAELGCAGENIAPPPDTGKGLDNSEGEEGAALTAARERGERAARAHFDLLHPARADGGAEATLERRGYTPERSEEAEANAGKTGAGTGAGLHCRDATVASDISEQDNKAEEAKQGDDAVKGMVEKLLLTSSSVALAVARPLSIKPSPVLEVEHDPHQVNSHGILLEIVCSEVERGRPAVLDQLSQTGLFGLPYEISANFSSVS